MYAKERQNAIANLVTRDRRLSVSRAAESFGVTPETVRRDLAVLERQGILHRVHGGAVPIDALTLIEPAPREPGHPITAHQSKKRIAKAAVALLPGDGGSVILDGGTTISMLAALIPPSRRLTVITNAPSIAAIISEQNARTSNVELHIVGGLVQPSTQGTVGARALATLSDLRVDVSFIGVNGLTLTHGLYTPNHDEASVKSAMIRAARRVVVLTDSRKFGRDSMVRFGRLGHINAIVTDDGISANDVRALEALDIDVVIA